MKYTNFSHILASFPRIRFSVLGLALIYSTSLAFPAIAQGRNSNPPVLEDDAALFGDENMFAFDNEFEFDKSTEELEDSFRKEAYDRALKMLMPLKPEEIRTLLEHFDRTVESTELPVHPYPRAESVVQNISLDPGMPPLTVRLAYGYVTTLSILDVSGAPWPIEDISWVGDFIIEESVVNERTHILRVSPQRKFAHGNVSMRLVGLNAPVIMTFETGRDVVHYRIDAVVPQRGPGARTPIMNRGITLSAGDPDMSIALGGVVPNGARLLNVSGVDGRTTAYVYNGMTYVRTPLTLLSPGWDSSVTSADGTNVYAMRETPVILLSDKGRMVRAHLTAREGLLNE